MVDGAGMRTGDVLPVTVVDRLVDGLPLSVEHCRRCGLAHSGLVVKRFEPPIVVSDRYSVTDWAWCPVAEAPILVCVEDVGAADVPALEGLP